MLKEKIKSLTQKFHNDTVACRRHLHMNPELSFQEFNTQKFVEEKLKVYGVTNYHRLANTGVVALIEGKNPGKKVVALRADMDALP
ncbi:MAG TPA: amidohydrolase, partial [Bacteroidia bacterium]|nr:amidohydrolase [Bacteroidia bacterium]